MSHGAFTLADVDQAPRQTGQFSAADLDSKPAAPDQFAQDRALTEAWAQNHPILGPIARFLVSGGQHAANAITDTPGQLYHAIVDPPKDTTEAALTPEQRVAYRLGGKDALEAGQDYAAGKVTPKGALSVLPEALGTGVGTTSGGAFYGKATEGAGAVADALSDVPKSKVTAPVRVAVKGINHALEKAPGEMGAGIGAAAGRMSGIPGGTEVGTAAGYALGKAYLPKVRIPGEGFGLPDRVTGGPESAPPYQPDPLDKLRNQEYPPAQPDYPAERPSIERIQPQQSSKVTPKQVEQQLNEALGGKPLQPNVPLKNQPMTGKPTAAVPDGFTPVKSSAITAYKYDPAAQELTTITPNGQQYTHAEVTPDEAQTFADAGSKGQAWNTIRENHVLVKQNGLPVKPVPRSVVVDPETGKPEFSDVIEAKQKAATTTPTQSDEDLTPEWQAELERLLRQKGKKSVQ